MADIRIMADIGDSDALRRVMPPPDALHDGSRPLGILGLSIIESGPAW